MAEAETTTRTLGDLRVWYIPQVPMNAFERVVPHVEGFEEQEMALATLLLDTMVGLSTFEFENNVKPDYSDAAGIQRWEVDGDGGFDWYDVDEDEYTE